jgi:hypothetical protein
MARARRLSLTEASDDRLIHFLIHQSDLVLVLCGCPAVWYLTRKGAQQAPEIIRGAKARAVHQLRQVFTALLIGTGLLARKARDGKTADLPALANRLNTIVREGIDALAELGDPYPPDLLDEHGVPIDRAASSNGARA